MTNKFFEELSRCLGKEQIESLSKEDRRLEIFLHGQPVLFVSPGNEVFMLPSGSKNQEANELYHRVTIAADRVFEYVEAKFLLSYNDDEFIRSLYDRPGIYLMETTRINNIKQRYDNGAQFPELTQAPLELHGSRRLRPEEIIFSDEVSELDGRLNFYMDCSFNPDEVFGTHVDSADNNNWLNIYAEYDLENSQVCDALKVILCREDGFDYEMAYQLNAEEKSAILDKMGQYCQEKYGQSLLEFAAEMESEITAMETPQM